MLYVRTFEYSEDDRTFERHFGIRKKIVTLVAGMSFSYILNIVLLFQLDIIHFTLSLITNQLLIATLY